MPELQNLHVHFLYPDGRRVKCGVQVIGGTIHNRATLEKMLRPHPKGTVAEKVIELDAAGKPVHEIDPADLATEYPARPASGTNRAAVSLNPSGIPGHLPPAPVPEVAAVEPPANV